MNEPENRNIARNEDGTFKPGVSGNPGGRPTDTLKAFMARKFRQMTDEEKEEWFEMHKEKISPLDVWKMAEGNPKQDTTVELDINEPSAVRLD